MSGSAGYISAGSGACSGDSWSAADMHSEYKKQDDGTKIAYKQQNGEFKSQKYQTQRKNTSTHFCSQIRFK